MTAPSLHSHPPAVRSDVRSVAAGGHLAVHAPPVVRPRRGLGALVVACVMVLQFAKDFVAGRETARIVAQLVFMSFELPILMLARSA